MSRKAKQPTLCVEHLDERVLLSSLNAPQAATAAAHIQWWNHRYTPTPTPKPTPTPTPVTTLPPPIAGTSYKLVFDDEFNGTSINPANWNEVGPWGHPVSSTLAGEKYLASNVTEAGGLATITAQQVRATWTTGILSTDTTQSWTYGFIDVRAKLPPAAPGFWPAIWLYGANSSLQELDIMENWAGDATHVYQTMHEASGAIQQVAPTSTDWTTSFHDFQMLWKPGRVTFYIDNVQTASFTTNVPNEAMYLVLNFDVGAANDWGGGTNASTPSSAQFQIDYARVYQER